MLKNIVRLENIIDGRTCHFTCDNDTPIPIVKESLFQFMKYIGQIEDSAKTTQDNAKYPQQSEVKEELKTE